MLPFLIELKLIFFAVRKIFLFKYFLPMMLLSFLFLPVAIPYLTLKLYLKDNQSYFCDELHIFYLKNLFPSDLEAISVKYIKRLTPKLIFPAFKIGIFLRKFFDYFPGYL